MCPAYLKKYLKGRNWWTTINNLPFGLHWPGYNYLDPGTKLNKRPAKCDKPVDKLDAAAREHDIF